MKKIYSTPSIEHVELNTTSFIQTSPDIEIKSGSYGDYRGAKQSNTFDDWSENDDENF